MVGNTDCFNRLRAECDRQQSQEAGFYHLIKPVNTQELDYELS